MPTKEGIMTELTQYVYAFDKANEPIARAKDGDEFSFRTLDCYSGQVCTEEDIVGESFNFSRTNGDGAALCGRGHARRCARRGCAVR